MDEPSRSQTDREFRNRRFTLGVVTSILSKAAAFGTQILAIPIAVRYCGLDTYALYLSLVAASLAPSILLLRLGPSFIARVAGHHQLRDRKALSAEFRNSIGLTLLNCIAAGLLSAAALYWLPITQFFSGLTQPGINVLPALVLLSALNIVGCLFATIESFQAGLHETHMLYARSTISNVISLFLLLVIVPISPTLLTLVVILQVVPFLTRLANALLFMWRQRSILSHPSSGYPTNILSDALRFTFTVGFCAYVGFQAPLLILTTQTDVARAGFYAVAMQLVLQLQGLITVAMAPTIPALANAISAGEMYMVTRVKRWTMWAINALGLLAVPTAVFISSWSTPATELSYEARLVISVSAALFFWSIAFENFLFTFLLATRGGRSSELIYRSQTVRSLLVAFAAIVLTSLRLDLWALIAMALAGLIAAIVPLWRLSCDETAGNQLQCLVNSNS